jgi:hypothetical protein
VLAADGVMWLRDEEAAANKLVVWPAVSCRAYSGDLGPTATVPATMATSPAFGTPRQPSTYR